MIFTHVQTRIICPMHISLICSLAGGWRDHIVLALMLVHIQQWCGLKSHEIIGLLRTQRAEVVVTEMEKRNHGAQVEIGTPRNI